MQKTIIAIRIHLCLLVLLLTSASVAQAWGPYTHAFVGNLGGNYYYYASGSTLSIAFRSGSGHGLLGRTGFNNQYPFTTEGTIFLQY
jgi:hypothetical protein